MGTARRSSGCVERRRSQGEKNIKSARLNQSNLARDQDGGRKADFAGARVGGIQCQSQKSVQTLSGAHAECGDNFVWVTHRVDHVCVRAAIYRRSARSGVALARSSVRLHRRGAGGESEFHTAEVRKYGRIETAERTNCEREAKLWR